MKNEASSSNSREESVVADCGRRRSSCGYCKSSDRTSISHGLWARSVTVNDYQDLLDHGWRRSGCFLYKPEMERTCCPSYTIRLKASDFVPSKEQLRVYRRMQRFLDGTLEVRKPIEFTDSPNTSKHTGSSVHCTASSSAGNESFSCGNKGENKAEEFMHHLSDQIDKVVHTYIESGEFPSGIQLPKAVVKKVSHAKRKLSVEGSEDLLYSSNIAFQVAATLRRKQSAEDIQPLQMSRQSAEENDLSPKSIAEKLACSLNQLANISGLSIRACNGHINFYSAAKDVSAEGGVQIVALPQESGGESKSSCAKKSSEHPQGQKRKLEIRLKRSSFDPEEYALYRRYQIKVHNDPPARVTESSYRSFLVDTPLLFVSPYADGLVPPCGFGSFHQQYIIDGKLVAVGVIDILPGCLSSKYLFWDPDYAFLSLGKYSALQEIGWVKENQAYSASLQYYYLGYYIHSCSKMRYKAAYYPSELLCPFRYQWVAFHIARPLLDKKKYVILSDIASLQDGESSRSCIPASVMELQHDDIGLEDSNDVLMDDDYTHICCFLDLNAIMWVAFLIARPLLDKKKYVILSDIASLQDGESSRSCIPESVMELQHDDIGLEDSNDVLMDDDYTHICCFLDLNAIMWVAFHIARPLLDKKKYVILSDIASLQDGESSRSCIPESVMELQHDDIGLEDSNDVLMDDDEEMIQMESGSSDDELDPETSGLGSAAIDDGDLTNVLIGLRGSRRRYKDLQRVFGPNERNYLETQLRSYQRVVGVQLSERMVYSLG